MTKTLKIALLASAASLYASAAFAGPVSLTDTEMDAVAAGGVPESTSTAFVCPVIVNGEGLANAGEQTGFTDPTTGVVVIGFQPDGSYYTVIPQQFHIPVINGEEGMTVPLTATNTGSPGGGYSSPGPESGSTYTAIWK